MSKIHKSKIYKLATAGLATAVLMAIASCSQAPNSTAANNSAASNPAANNPAATTETSAAPADDTKQAKAAEQAEAAYRLVENVTLPAPAADPLKMALELRQPSLEAIGSEQIKLSYPAPDQAVVIVTRNGLPDDSVRAIRTRYDFELAATATGTNPVWEMVEVKQQNKCQPGRGSAEWTADLCQ